MISESPRGPGKVRAFCELCVLTWREGRAKALVSERTAVHPEASRASVKPPTIVEFTGRLGTRPRGGENLAGEMGPGLVFRKTL